MIGWSAGRVAKVIAEALGPTDGWIAVVGEPALARALEEAGRKVTTIARGARALKRAPAGLVAADGVLPVGDGALAGVVGDGLAALAEWTRAVAAGGRVVLLDKGEPEDASRAVLCGGLVDLEQRAAGRVTVTSGRVVRF